MSNSAHLGIGLAFISAIILSGCNARPKPTFDSSRRILALQLVSTKPYSSITKFLLNTNNDEGSIVGRYGGIRTGFKGDISVMTIVSNATAWNVQIKTSGTFDGANENETTVIQIPYPQSRHVTLGRIGVVTGWFLSDEQMREFDRDNYDEIVPN